MAAQSWPELIDNAAAKLPVDDLRWAFWGLLGMTVAAALMYVRRILVVPSVPTAGQIVDEMVARGKVPLVQAPVDVEAAVHRAINGSAERLKRVEAAIERLSVEVDAGMAELRKEAVEIRKETNARHAENREAIGEMRGTLGLRRQQ